MEAGAIGYVMLYWPIPHSLYLAPFPEAVRAHRIYGRPSVSTLYTKYIPLIAPYKTINDTPSRVPTWCQTAISTYYLIVTLSEFDISGDHFGEQVFVLCLGITVMVSMTELHCNQSLWQKLI